MDNVNHPLHYNAGKIECIDAIEAAITGLNGKEAFLTGQVIKYIWRWGKKNGREDLMKAAWYLDRLLAMSNEEYLSNRDRTENKEELAETSDSAW